MEYVPVDRKTIRSNNQEQLCFINLEVNERDPEPKARFGPVDYEPDNEEVLFSERKFGETPGKPFFFREIKIVNVLRIFLPGKMTEPIDKFR